MPLSKRNSHKSNNAGKKASKRQSLKWLDNLRSKKIEAQVSEFPIKILEFKDKNNRPVFTGRQLFRLNENTKVSKLASLAKKASLKITSYNDATETTGGSTKLLEQADGVIYPDSNLAVFNSQLEENLSFLTSGASGNSHFTYAEPERFIYPAATSINNSHFDNNTKATWGLQAINILNSNRTGSGIKLAILDTGLNTNHIDFQSRPNVTGASFIPNEDIMDSLGHGTRCAGIACGIRKTNGPRYGVAPGVELFIGKVVGKENRGTDTSLFDGIEWALKNGCNVINISIVRALARGETAFSKLYEGKGLRALANRCLIIAAAGNESDRQFRVIKPVAEPANCPSIFAVGALDQNIGIANFSCGGLVPDGGQIDLAAPGVEILSSFLESKYNSDSGTSFASPFVAGLAALIWEENPGATAPEIWMKLTQKAKRLDLNASDVGAGLAFFA